MSLDTKAKRGSAMNLTMPWRPWNAEPSGWLPVASRLSLLRLCSATAPATLDYGWLHGVISIRPSLGGRITCRHSLSGDISILASLDGNITNSPSLLGEITTSPSLVDFLRGNP